MRHIAIALVAAVLGLAAGLTSFASTASAQYYYDRGYYPPPPPPYYRERPRYGAPGGGSWRPAYVDRHGQQTFVPRPGGRCPRGYTVQDGVCKPYRGY